METWWYSNEVSEGIEEIVLSAYKLYSDLKGCPVSDNPQTAHHHLNYWYITTVWPGIVILNG